MAPGMQASGGPSQARLSRPGPAGRRSSRLSRRPGAAPRSVRRSSCSAVSARMPNMRRHGTLPWPRTRTWRPPKSSFRRPLKVGRTPENDVLQGSARTASSSRRCVVWRRVRVEVTRDAQRTDPVRAPAGVAWHATEGRSHPAMSATRCKLDGSALAQASVAERSHPAMSATRCKSHSERGPSERVSRAGGGAQTDVDDRWQAPTSAPEGSRPVEDGQPSHCGRYGYSAPNAPVPRGGALRPASTKESNCALSSAAMSGSAK